MPRRKFYPVVMAEPVIANTVMFDAGPVRIGVEYRYLNPVTSRASLDSSDGARMIRDQFKDLVDEGLSLHVFEADTNLEMLRFDCFEEDPHYHYIHQLGDEPHIELVDFDPIAHGSSEVVWAIETMQERMPEMVDAAGYPEVAAALRSFGGLDPVLEQVRNACRNQLPSHARGRTSQSV